MNATVVIVSFRTPALTRKAARSALESGADQVIVVDNASHDETIASLSGMTDVVVRENARNVGFGAAANHGARTATGDTLIFLNSDAELDASAVSQMRAELSGHRLRAVVGPRLVSPDGWVQPSAGLLPGPVDLTVRAMGLQAIGRRLAALPIIGAAVLRSQMARQYASAEGATETIETNMVSGACFAIGREAFAELGGFDERFFMYFEDADLCKRAGMARMPIRYVPSAVVSHVGGASSGEDYHFGPLHARSMRQYLSKWYGPAGSTLALLLMWLRAVGMTLALRSTTGRAWRALWAATRDADPRR